MIDTHNVRVGDVVEYEGDRLRVYAVQPPGYQGRAATTGPVVCAHTDPRGYALTFDETVEEVRLALP